MIIVRHHVKFCRISPLKTVTLRRNDYVVSELRAFISIRPGCKTFLVASTERCCIYVIGCIERRNLYVLRFVAYRAISLKLTGSNLRRIGVFVPRIDRMLV